jgi:hypothetical protein
MPQSFRRAAKIVDNSCGAHAHRHENLAFSNQMKTASRKAFEET